MRISGTIAAVLSIVICRAPAQAPVAQWSVIGLVGKWKRSGANKDLKLGATIHPGEKLVKEGNPKFGSVTLFFGESHRSIACDDQETLPDHSNVGCVQPIEVPALPKPEPGIVASLLAEVQRHFTKEPERYFETVSRDLDGLRDGIASSQGQSTDLTLLAGGLSKGKYSLTFNPISTSAGTNTASPFSFSWDPETAKPLLVPGLGPGLYLAKAVTDAGESAGNAWWLVVPESEFASKSEAFKKVTSFTAGWANDSPAESIRAVNRAALTELSEKR